MDRQQLLETEITRYVQQRRQPHIREIELSPTVAEQVHRALNAPPTAWDVPPPRFLRS